MKTILSQLEHKLQEEVFKNLHPSTLFSPAQYMMDLGGKRLRPLILMLTGKAFGASDQSLYPAAIAMEVFHNFSLVHDDVLDDAPLRRGKPTVYRKWDTNTAILSGDVMLVFAYDYMARLPENILPLALRMFNRMARIVCQGQQLDMDFQNIEVVDESDYLEMIQFKTAELIATCFELAALCSGQSLIVQEKIYSAGLKLGISFQVQDDWLDCFGVSFQVGKQIGGDILSKKKTLIYLHTLKIANEVDKKYLLSMYKSDNIINNEDLQVILSLYKKHDIDGYVKSYFEELYLDGILELKSLFDTNDNEPFNLLLDFIEAIKNRKS